ncbi:MAG TPA: hypothetical protein VGQ57_17080 [Polyangiaceae bacterium]|jgi:hypothetical protein|nr:hypothetical protein [Polyangiaceae bacterium]
MSHFEDKAPLVGAVLLIFAVIATTLILAISLTGILHPGIYGRETANWAAQASGQDWVDLLLAVPWLALSAARARRGSRGALLLLAGGLGYAIYELMIYAFALHFNALFLVYCAALGFATCAFLGILHALLHHDVRGWFSERTRVRGAGIFLVLVGVGFALLWLSEIVPALVHGTAPASVVEAGIPSNPVHVLDLSLVLPAHVVGGVLLLRRHSLGYVAGPVLLAFGILMAASIAGMLVVMFLRGVAGALSVAGPMAALSALAAFFLSRLLRSAR